MRTSAKPHLKLKLVNAKDLPPVTSRIPLGILADPRLAPVDKLITVALDVMSEQGVYRLDNATLGTLTGCSARKAGNALFRLHDAGWIAGARGAARKARAITLSWYAGGGLKPLPGQLSFIPEPANNGKGGDPP